MGERGVSADAFFAHPGALGAALANLELGVRLADDVNRAFALDDLAIGVAVLGGSKGGSDFHDGLGKRFVAEAPSDLRRSGSVIWKACPGCKGIFPWVVLTAVLDSRRGSPHS